MAIYYHISLNLFHNGEFYPRIPYDRYSSEDNAMKRVCVSDSVMGCFNAIPDEQLFTCDHHGYFKLFEIDTDALGICEKSIIKPLTLYEEKGVFDALLTNEHWILTDFVVPKEKQSICKLTWSDDCPTAALTYSQLKKLSSLLAKEMPLPTSTHDLFEELTEYVNTSDISHVEELLGEGLVNSRNIIECGAIKSHSDKHQTLYLEIIDSDHFNGTFNPFLKQLAINRILQNEVEITVPPNVDIADLLIAHYSYLEGHSLNKI
jgi:hypothetical protein